MNWFSRQTTAMQLAVIVVVGLLALTAMVMWTGGEADQGIVTRYENAAAADPAPGQASGYAPESEQQRSQRQPLQNSGR